MVQSLIIKKEMFANDYQGGLHFEIFTTQGKNPLAHWKCIGGSGINKEFDKSTKCNLLLVDGETATTKLQLPRDSKQSLGLIQRYLVMQVFLIEKKDFAVELGVTDVKGNRCRLLMSTTYKEISTTPLHKKIPLALVRLGVWLNLCVDVHDLSDGDVRSIDQLTICGTCKLRRIFTMKSPLQDDTGDTELYDGAGDLIITDPSSDHVEVPKCCQMPYSIPQYYQLLNLYKIKTLDWNRNGRKGLRPGSDDNVSKIISSPEVTQIAFGKRISVSERPQVAKTNKKPGETVSQQRPSSHKKPLAQKTNKSKTTPRDVSSNKNINDAAVPKSKIQAPALHDNDSPGTAAVNDMFNNTPAADTDELRSEYNAADFTSANNSDIKQLVNELRNDQNMR